MILGFNGIYSAVVFYCVETGLLGALALAGTATESFLCLVTGIK